MTGHRKWEDIKTNVVGGGQRHDSWPILERTDLANQDFAGRTNVLVGPDGSRVTDFSVPGKPFGCDGKTYHYDMATQHRIIQRAYEDGVKNGLVAQVDGVPAEVPQYRNGQTTEFRNGETAWDKGNEWGHTRGEVERQALEIALTELRSVLRVVYVMAAGREPYGDITLFINENFPSYEAGT